MDKGFLYPMSFRGLSPEELLPDVSEMFKLVAAVSEANRREIAKIQDTVFDKIPYKPRQVDW